MQAFVHFVTADGTDIGRSGVRDFVRIPHIGEILAVGPDGPFFCVLTVSHGIADGEEPSITVHAGQVEREHIENMAAKLTAFLVST